MSSKQSESLVISPYRDLAEMPKEKGPVIQLMERLAVEEWIIDCGCFFDDFYISACGVSVKLIRGLFSYKMAIGGKDPVKLRGEEKLFAKKLYLDLVKKQDIKDEREKEMKKGGLRSAASGLLSIIDKYERACEQKHVANDKFLKK
jgi:hypothetical protein